MLPWTRAPLRWSIRSLSSATKCTPQTHYTTVPVAPKAAFLVIGNEILNGSVTDTNTPFLAKLLYSRGVDLVRVEYIPDEIDDIKSSVISLRSRVGPEGFLFTSGGIGPTHDDVTYESIAAAVGAKLELHEPTVARMRDSYQARGIELNEARLRMATLPSPAEVLFTEGLWVPLVNLQGIYILPGIPRLFQSMVSAHQARFTGVAATTSNLYTNVGEGDVAVPLAQVAAQFPTVSIGSYPATTDSVAYRVRLSFVSRDKAALQEAVQATKLVLDVTEEP